MIIMVYSQTEEGIKVEGFSSFFELPYITIKSS